MVFSKWLTRSLTAVLVAFHVWLLATQWMAGRLAEPALLLRWAAAIAIAIALRALYRSGVSLVSRKSLVIWLLAAMLHAPAMASRTGDITLNALPEAAMTAVLQIAAAAGALALTILVFAAILRRRTRAATQTWTRAEVSGRVTRTSDGYSAVVSARPPPVFA